MSRVIDLAGKKFGRLTVIERAATRTGQAYWNCICECSETTIVRGTHLTSGRTLSCGCYSREKATKHGKYGTPEYRTYYNMIKRCEYSADRRYKDYGGRGIKVCPEWRESFDKFYTDMGPRPASNYSIERIDVNGDYGPKNCLWASPEAQEHNKRVRKDSITGVRGVVLDKKTGKYIAQIYAYGKMYRIGTFETLEKAAVARKEREDLFWEVLS